MMVTSANLPLAEVTKNQAAFLPPYNASFDERTMHSAPIMQQWWAYGSRKSHTRHAPRCHRA